MKVAGFLQPACLLFFSVYLENYKAVNIDHAERYLLSTYKSRQELGCTV